MRGFPSSKVLGKSLLGGCPRNIRKFKGGEFLLPNPAAGGRYWFRGGGRSPEGGQEEGRSSGLEGTNGYISL